MVIDDKWGEIVYKDSEKTTKEERNKDVSDRGRKGERYDKGRGSVKILSTQVGGQAHELVWCI